MEKVPEGYISISEFQRLEKENEALKIRLMMLEQELKNIKRMISGNKSDCSNKHKSINTRFRG